MVPPGVKFINVEIYDERSFTMDELIAWAQIPIPPAVFKGQIHEEWFALSGKQGDGLEGSVNLVLSYMVSLTNILYLNINGYYTLNCNDKVNKT